MNVDTAFRQLRDANPVPEPASLRRQSQDTSVLLAATRQRSTEMQTQEETTGRTRQEPRTRRLLVGIAVAAAVLVAVGVTVGVALTLRTDGSTPPADQVTVPPEQATDQAEAVAVIEAAYAAFNAGDAEGWLSASQPQAVEPNELGLERGDVYAALHAAGHRIEVLQCFATRFGEWPGITDDGDGVATGHLVTCETKETNAFYGAAGIELISTSEWVINDGAVVGSDVEEDFGEADAFALDFRNWLVLNHKDAALGYETFPWMFPKERSVPAALEYVDEFVESSPDWPRPSGS